MKNLHGENSRHGTLLLLWLVTSPWYRTAQCQPSSPCGNTKGKYSGSYAGCLSRISSDPSPRWRKILPLPAPFLSSSRMAVTSLHIGRLCVLKSTVWASWYANRTLRTYWFLINLPSRRNILTNEFTWFRNFWIVAAITLSKLFIIKHRIFTCASISLSKTYNCPKVGVHDSKGGEVQTLWHIAPSTRKVYPPSGAFTICSSIQEFLGKRFTHGSKCKNTVVRSDLD
jgi:hypothetical protein